MKFKKLKKLLGRYDSGKSTAAENQVVDIWYASFSKKPEEPSVFKDDLHKEAVRQQIWNQLPQNTVHISFFQRHRSMLLRLGAAALLLFVAVWGFRESSLAPRQSPANSEASQLAAHSTTTGERERKLVLLPDSSRVWLNANSQITIAANYGAGERQIYLKGEAFFDVKPDTSSPFLVKTASLQVEVLGTAFNVNTYANLTRAHVQVDHGTVAVSDDRQRLVNKLTKGQSLTYHIADRTATLGKALQAGSWREGKVVLERATFDELAQVIFNLYAVRLVTERSEPTSYSYNLQVHANRSLEQTMTIIARMHRLNYRRENNAIILY